jgi:arylsulfatase A-like enzyme
VSLIDVPPTLLDAAGIEVPEDMEGRSILPLLGARNSRGRADDEWPDDVFVQISEAQTGRAVRTQRWKYSVSVPNGEKTEIPAADSYTEEFLYDLKHDPYEQRNLIHMESHGEVRNRMRERLLRRIELVEKASPKIVEAEVQKSGQRKVLPEEVDA